MLKQIFINEIVNVIGHNPSQEEYKIFYEHVHDFIMENVQKGKKVYMSMVELEIYNCRDQYFSQCEECGDYFLPDEMNESGYCCLKCKPNYDPDMMPGGHDYY